MIWKTKGQNNLSNTLTLISETFPGNFQEL